MIVIPSNSFYMPELQQTNNELEQSLSEKFEALAAKFEEHSRFNIENLTKHQQDDAAHFIAIEEKMEVLATKADIKEMKEAFNDFVYAIQVFRSTSKWGYRSLLVLAGLIVAIVSIGGGFRTIISWFITIR